jgi:hypothetical protein
MTNSKTNSKIRTWDDAAYFRKGIIVKTEKDNPYKKGTMEFELVSYIISLSGTVLDAKLSTSLLNYLKKKKVFLSLDPWSLGQLGDKAVWLALNAGCIKFKHNINIRAKNFAVHMQSGLLDLFHEPAYLNKLTIQSPNSEKLQHLKQVALLSSDLKKKFNLPIMKESSGKIEISNYQAWMLDRSEAIPLVNPSLPIQTWAKSSPAYVHAQTRGIYHHLGDEMAFICAATQYGNCYIVGNDEFGDLLILGAVSHKAGALLDFHVGQICDPMDFDYIYSVPVTNAMYPSWRNQCFNYSSENHEQCKSNNLANSQFSNRYWKNDYFKEQAQRQMDELSVKQLNEKLISSIKKVMSEEDYITYQEQFSVNFVKNMNIFYMFSCWKLVDFKTQLGLDTSYEDFVEYFTNIKNTIFNLLEQDYNHFYLNDLDYKIGGKKVKKFLEPLFAELMQPLCEIKKLVLKYENLFQEDFSFFYKTVSHKAHCDIMNPKKVDKSGFFMKDGNVTKTQKLTLSQIFMETIDSKNSKQINISLRNNTLKENSRFIEKALNKEQNIFFNIHKEALKKSIANQLPQSENLYDLIDFWDTLDIPTFVVSEIVDMQNEYRIFVINNRPASGSPCFRNTTPFNAWDNGRFDPRLCNGHSAHDFFLTQDSRDRVAMYGRYAKKFTRELKKLYPELNNFVLDVAYSQDANEGKGGIIPIEINSITWSGAYQIDFRRVCSAIAKVPYHFSDMDNLGDFNNLLKEAENKLVDIKNQTQNFDSLINQITIGAEDVDEEDFNEEFDDEVDKLIDDLKNMDDDETNTEKKEKKL